MKHTLAIVGFGGMAGWHYDLIQDIEDLTVAGIWDIKEERRDYAASRQIHVYEGFGEETMPKAEEKTKPVQEAVKEKKGLVLEKEEEQLFQEVLSDFLGSST